MPKEVKLIYILIAGLVLGAACALWSDRLVNTIYSGYKTYGYPIAWKTIYGGATVTTDLLLLFANWLIWSIGLFLVLTGILYLLGWRPK